MKKRIRHSRFDHFIYILTGVVFVAIIIVNNVDIPGSSAAVTLNPNATYDANGDISQPRQTIGTLTDSSGLSLFTTNQPEADAKNLLNYFDKQIQVFNNSVDNYIKNNIARAEQETKQMEDLNNLLSPISTINKAPVGSIDMKAWFDSEKFPGTKDLIDNGAPTVQTGIDQLKQNLNRYWNILRAVAADLVASIKTAFTKKSTNYDRSGMPWKPSPLPAEPAVPLPD